MHKERSRAAEVGLAPPANDDRRPGGEDLDPRIIKVAEAIGRLLARRDAKRHQAANDNRRK